MLVRSAWTQMSAITWFGIGALTFMVVMYGLERRERRFILGFALGCALSSIYGFLAGVWPFGVVEAVWCLVAIRRFTEARQPRASSSSSSTE
jgi:hypothetical protein